MVPALHGHQNPSLFWAPLGENAVLCEPRAGGSLKVGAGSWGIGKRLMPRCRGWDHFYLSHALVQGEQDGIQQHVLWGFAQANCT